MYFFGLRKCLPCFAHQSKTLVNYKAFNSTISTVSARNVSKLAFSVLFPFLVGNDLKPFPDTQIFCVAMTNRGMTKKPYKHQRSNPSRVEKSIRFFAASLDCMQPARSKTHRHGPRILTLLLYCEIFVPFLSIQ